MKGPTALVAACLVAGGVLAATSIQETWTVDPSARTPPVTLAAGSSGSTNLGTSLTGASTSAALPAIGSIQVLRLQAGNASYDVHVEAVSASGFGVLDSATVTLGPPSTTQVVITLGSMTQSLGSVVTLPALGSDLEIRASGTVLASGTLTLRIVMSPNGQAAPVVSYPYVLTLS